MKELKQDTRMTILNRAPVMLLSLISMTILTRWLGPDGNGVYTFIFANINLLVLILGLQSETATLHYLAKNDADQDAITTLSLLTVGISFLIGALVLLAAGLLMPAFQNIVAPEGQPYGYFIWFTLLSFIFRKSQNTFLAIQRATLRFTAYNKYQLWSQVIPIVFYVFGFIILQKANTLHEIIPVFNYILAGQAMVSIVGAWMIFSKNKFKLSFSFSHKLKSFYTYSAKSMVDGIAKFINRRIDIYFVQAFKGVSALGQYGLAAQINNFTQEAILPFVQVMNPYLVKNDESTRIEIARRMARIIFSITLILASGIILLFPLVIPILFGTAFTPSIRATQILSVAVIISTLRIVFASYFQSINRLRFTIQSNWLGVIVTILLDIALIPSFGIEGAALASITAYTTSFLFLFFHFSSLTGTGFKDIFILRKSDIIWLLKKEDLKSE